MPIPFRADLRVFLTEFADRHRGVRLGQMFGLPAGYIGRRLFTCLIDDGLIVRLPPDIARRETRARGTRYSRRGGRLGSWVMYRPRTLADARRLVPMLELAVQHLAEYQMQTPNSQDSNSQDSSSQTSIGSWCVGRWELKRKRS